MQIEQCIAARMDIISQEVMTLVEDQSISLTEKNRKMKPLVEEKKVLERTLNELILITQTDYSGRCSG